MKRPPIPDNEPERLEALDRYQVLDSSPEAAFDGITELAAKIAGTPIAYISLVDRVRQWFKSKVGLDVAETPRSVSFCGHAILADSPLVVPDARLDPRFRDNPMVSGGTKIRFYAGFPLRTPDGLAVGTLCVVDRVPRTLTHEQTKLLASLAQQVVAQLELRHRVAELKQQVAGEADEAGHAAEVQQRKKELLAMFMHDLKSPLTAIVLNSHAIESDPAAAPSTLQPIHEIKSAAGSMLRLVMDLLDLLRSDEVGLVARPADANLATIVEDAMAAVRPHARARGQTVEARGLGGLKTLRVDSELLRRTLENLLSNAVKYAPRDGEIRVEAHATSSAVELRVIDHGPGIPSALREKIFERYVKVDPGSRGSHGLGLAFCKLAMRAMGGEIWVEDAKGGGACFALRVPRLAARVVEAKPPRPRPQAKKPRAVARVR